MPPPHREEALSDDARLTSVASVWPKSRTERPRKTKIGTEVAHVSGDSDTTFKVNLQGAGHIVAASHTACYCSQIILFIHVDRLSDWRVVVAKGFGRRMSAMRSYCPT